MPAATRPKLKPGKVYRTRDLQRYGKNAPRMAKRLVSEGQLRPIAHGLFVHPETSSFGEVPPSKEELMRGYLKGRPFIFSGPEQWNPLRLGSTAMFTAQLVYNNVRSGEVVFGGRRFILRRVAFPETPSPEYFTVDLTKNHQKVGVSLDLICSRLTHAIAEGRLKPSKLRREAKRFGTKASVACVEKAIAAAGR